MLVLTRKQNEKIRIGDDITITVFKIKGKGVRLGIEAPAHIPVLRGELVCALSSEEDTAARTASTKNVRKPASVRQPAKTNRHSQLPTTHWPTTPEYQKGDNRSSATRNQAPRNQHAPLIH